MKIGIVEIEGFSQGKENVIDRRVDKLKEMFNSAKKVYIQVEIITDTDKLKEADGIVCPLQKKLDLVVSDLDFVETRLERSEDEAEKNLFSRFKEKLEKEEFLSELTINDEEKKLISGYPLLTVKPVFLAEETQTEDKDEVLCAAYYSLGYISFFTAGEKDAHAWSIRKGANAWEASGCIHSDIQKGFIRAEVMGYQDLINAGNFNSARSNNCLRLENKEYIVQDGDLINFRFNK